MKLGIDVDGVLACFFKAYEDLTVEVAGVDLFPARYPAALPPTWNWPEFYGYSNETMKEVWARIKSLDHFWTTHSPLPGAVEFLQVISRHGDEVYFITDRPGKRAQTQTAVWLTNHGFPYPSVVLSSGSKGPSKGDVCAALKIDYYLDDKYENIIDVEEKSPSTKAVILDYPYNQGPTKGPRVTSLRAALEEL